MTTPLDRFITVLSDQYAQLYESDPITYSMAKSKYSPAELAEKMTMSLKARTGSKDGKGIERTCKALGIKYTYKSIEGYLS